MFSPFRRIRSKHKVLYIIYLFHHNNKWQHLFFTFSSLFRVKARKRRKMFSIPPKHNRRVNLKNPCKIRVMHSFHRIIHSIMLTHNIPKKSDFPAAGRFRQKREQSERVFNFGTFAILTPLVEKNLFVSHHYLFTRNACPISDLVLKSHKDNITKQRKYIYG